MDKRDVKNILISMRTHQNETAVNKLLGEIDFADESKIQEILNQLGNSEEAVKEELNKMIVARLKSDEKYPINEMFTYGVFDASAHLHLPVENLKKIKGISSTLRKMNIINLYLLDAIQRIAEMKNEGFYRFEKVEKIYMISPILVAREQGFLEGIGFDTIMYTAEQLSNPAFLAAHSEARLAKEKFGDKQNVGRAQIMLEKIFSQEWQDKKKQKIEEFAKQGITMELNNRTGEAPEQ